MQADGSSDYKDICSKDWDGFIVSTVWDVKLRMIYYLYNLHC